jgi:membrane peptidoglycan carboxypeptidase
VITPRKVAEQESGDAPTGPAGAAPQRRRRGRWVAGLVAAVCVVAAAGVAVGYAVTPSVSTAGTLVRSQEAAHHSAGLSGAVPARFASALVATEDHRFYSAPGIDPIALVRVIAGAATGRADQGGSTLSVQLAKMLYTPRNDEFPAKSEQAVLAVKFNIAYSKAEILRMYADVVNFGAGYYGLNAASCGYFGIRPASLSWGQAAVLAGLVQAPAVYDPQLYPAQAHQREKHVLGRLVATGKLSARQAAAALAAPLNLKPAGPSSGCH